MKKIIVLLVLVIPVFVARYANAQVQTFTGKVSVPVTVTQLVTNSKGQIKFTTVHESFEGTVPMFINTVTNSVAMDPKGDFLVFQDTSGNDCSVFSILVG
jgi:hypothetical protein